MPAERARPVSAWQAPYCSASSLEATLRYIARRPFPEPVSVESLTTIGITQHVARRVFRALRLTGFLDDDYRWTPVLDRWRSADEAEKRELLAEIVLDLYEPVFKRIGPPPVTASSSEIQSGFARAEPQSQRHLMPYTFTGLCRMSGLLIEAAGPIALDDEEGRRTDLDIVLGPRARIKVQSIIDRSQASPEDEMLYDHLIETLRSAKNARARLDRGKEPGGG